MTKQEHHDAYARLVRESESRMWWQAYGDLVRFGLALLGLLLAAAVVTLSGDCGDVVPR